MTIIRPRKNPQTIRKTIIFFGALLLVGVAVLIVIYNRTVEIEHGITELRKDFEQVQARNAELKDGFFKLFSNENVERVAREKHLIRDKEPQFMEVAATWDLNSDSE